MTIQSRRCAYCGKTGGTPMTLLRKMATEGRMKLLAPESDYFHVMCARRVQTYLKSLGREAT